MRHLLLAVFLMGMVMCAVAALADTRLSMSGDARIYGNYWSRYQYTGWNYNGTRTHDSFTIWERFRLKTDFQANENLKFRLAVQVNDAPGHSPWGSGTFTVVNPANALEVYGAYVQFAWPGSGVKFTVGYQDFDLPFSADWLGANPVLGGTTAAAAVVEIPVGEAVKVVGGGMRLLDTFKDFSPTTTQAAGNLDGCFLTLPITLEGFAATPWGMVAAAGRDGDYVGTTVGNGPNSDETLAANLFSVAGFASDTFRNARNVYWWAGSTLAVSALDPFKFYADVVYGAGNEGDRAVNRRAGLFADLAAEYGGWEALTPRVAFWYATGEDGSVRNGSERVPCVVDYWGPASSLLFNSGQELNFGFMGVNPAGSFGLVAALDKMTFVPDLSHRLVVSLARGTSSSRGLRQANLLAGTGNYVQMGRDLTVNESVVAVNVDTRYDIYENLAAILETGWSHGDFQSSVWGRRFTREARGGDAWKLSVGFAYKF